MASTNQSAKGGNSTDITAPNIYFDVTVIVILTVICVTGLCGNFIVASIVLSRKKMQTATNWFVFNLAISHIAIILITIPFWIILPRIDWPFGHIPCKFFVMPVMEHFTGVCVLTHTAVGVARYIIVRNSSRTRRAISDISVRITIATIWIIAFLFLSAPLMGVLGYFEITYIKNEQKYYCKLFWCGDARRYIYRVLAFTLTYVVPMVATGFSYVKIHNIVEETLKCLNGHVSAETFSTRQQQTKQMNTMLMTMYVLFAITTLPLQLFFFLHAFYVIPNTIMAQVIMNILFVIFYSQVVINPLVLFHMGENFRKEMYKSFICRCCNRFGGMPPKAKEGFKVIGDHTTLRESTRLTSVASGRMRIESKGQQKYDGECNNETHNYSKPSEVNTEIFNKKISPEGVRKKIKPVFTIEENNYSKPSEMNTEIFNKKITPEGARNKIKPVFTIEENANEEICELLQDDVPDLKAYYDDGTLMCIYDKAIGVVSLAHDNGRETTI